MFRLKKFLFSALFVLAFVGQTNAGVPVTNPVNMGQLAQQIGLTMQQVNQLTSLLESGMKRLEEAQYIRSAVTGRWSIKNQIYSAFKRELEGFIAYNVPAKYADLVRSAANYNIGTYFQKRRTEYPELNAFEIDPWNKSSAVVKQLKDEQDANDAAIAYMEASYDSVPKRMEYIQYLMNQGPQPNVNAAVNLNTMAVLEQALAMQQLIQLNTVKSSAEARARNREYVEGREWSKFVGVPDPGAKYGYQRK